MQTLKDGMGRIVATIETDDRGVQTIRTQLGRILGTYDPKTNMTRTFLGVIVGYGNLLRSLIEK